jgi:predicted nuclease of predicted toxin-antitoxin system
VKFKLDENIPRDAADLMRVRRLDVHTVIDEALGGQSDPTVLESAGVEGRILITLDRGFGDVRAYRPGTHPGIIVLRPDDQRTATIVRTIELLLDHHDVETLTGCITIVQRNVLRVRRPPGAAIDDSGPATP